MTIPPLVTRTKRTVDVLRERQEMSVRSLLICAEPPFGVQLSDWDIEQQRASKKNTLAHVADILNCRSTRAMTVVIVDVSLPLEVELARRADTWNLLTVFSWYLKMATACGQHVVHECTDAAYGEFLAQRVGLCDEALGVCAFVSGHNPDHGACAWDKAFCFEIQAAFTLSWRRASLPSSLIPQR